MKTVWLTQQEYDDAWQRIREFQIDYPDIDLPIYPMMPEIITDTGPLPLTNGIRLLRFRRNRIVRHGQEYRGWELVTPVQIAEEWLVKEMQ